MARPFKMEMKPVEKTGRAPTTRERIGDIEYLKIDYLDFCQWLYQEAVKRNFFCGELPYHPFRSVLVNLKPKEREAAQVSVQLSLDSYDCEFKYEEGVLFLKKIHIGWRGMSDENTDRLRIAIGQYQQAVDFAEYIQDEMRCVEIRYAPLFVF
jgi:hypothetical protein